MTDPSYNGIGNIVAHEFTHVLVSSLTNRGRTATFINEGMADLTRGVDHRYKNLFEGFVKNPNELAKYVNVNAMETEKNEYYAGGYMFYRWLAKQSAVFDADALSGSMPNAPDTPTVPAEPTVPADSLNTIIGSNGNDVLLGTTAVDYFVYSLGGGSDVIGNTKDSKTLYRADDKIVIIDGNGLDDIYFTDKKNTLTVAFKRDNRSKLTINKNSSLDAVEFYIGSDLNSALASDAYSYGLTDDVTLDAGGNKLSVKPGNTSAVTVDAADIVSTAKTIDGSNASGAVKLIGNSNANVLVAGTHGSTLDGGSNKSNGKGTADKLHGGSGADVFIYNADGVNDIIYGYDGSKDKIMLVGVADNFSIDTANAKVFKDNGKSIVLTIGKGKLTIDKPAGVVHFVDANDRTILDYGIELPDGVSLNANKTALTIGEGAALETDTISVNDTLFTAYVPKLNEIDASAYEGELELHGANGKANVLRASKGGSTLAGGNGNDQLHGGNGSDTFVYSAKGGKDVVYNFADGDRIHVSDTSVLKSMFVESGKDVILKLDNKNTLTLKNVAGNRITFSGADGVEMTYGYTLPGGLSYNSNRTGIVVSDKTQIDSGLTIDLNDDDDYYATARNVDLRKVNASDITVLGDQQNNIIYASDSDMNVYGGLGNDQLYAPTVDGATVNYYYAGGKDVINNYDPERVAINIDENSSVISGIAINRSSFVEKGNDLVVTFNRNNTLTIKDATKYLNTGKMLNIAGVEYGWQLDDGLTYDARRTSIGVSNKTLAESNGMLNIDLTSDDYAPTVKKIDLNGLNVSASLIGNSLANTLYASGENSTLEGGAGNDVLYCSTVEGAGTTIVYGSGDGKDVVYNYSSGDTIRLKGDVAIGDANFVEKGNDIIINVGRGNITLKNAPRDAISVVGDAQTFTYNPLPTGLSYNAQKTIVTAAKTYGSATLDVNALGLAGTLKEINASAVNGSLSIVGNALNNVIKASKGGSTMDGGAGNDTLFGGKGADVFKYSGGNDFITNYTADQDVIEIDGAVTSGRLAGSNVELTIGSGKLTIKGVVNKKLTVKDENGQSEYLFTKANGTLNKARVSSSSQLSADDYWFVPADDAMSDELNELMTSDPIVDNALADVDDIGSMMKKFMRQSTDMLAAARHKTKR